MKIIWSTKPDVKVSLELGFKVFPVARGYGARRRGMRIVIDG